MGEYAKSMCTVYKFGQLTQTHDKDEYRESTPDGEEEMDNFLEGQSFT